MTTIPKFSHALFISEMVFEHNHQPLKAFLARNTNSSCHNSSVYNNLARDWFRRVFELHTLKDRRNDTEDGISLNAINRSLRCLFFGIESQKLQESKVAHAELIKEMDEKISTLLTPSFIHRLDTCYSSSMTEWPVGKWVPRRPKSSSSSYCSSKVGADMLELLQQKALSSSETFTFYSSATFRQSDGRITRRHYDHHCLKCGNVFEFITEKQPSRSTILTPSRIGKGTKGVWLLRALLANSTDDMWAIATKGMLVEEGPPSNLFNFQSDSSDTTCLVRMTSNVRKSFSITPTEEQQFHSLISSNANYTDGGTKLRVVRRRDGYPPRRA